MSSVMIWSVESVLLGLWALVLSSYSTPLHVFIARSHVSISSFTMILHLYVKARGLVVGSAVAQAFVCAVTALFLVYLLVLFADGSGSDPMFFNMPSVGVFSLDACVGLAWFTAAMISAMGMALSFTQKESDEVPARKTFLMFHTHGFHLVVGVPCLAICYLSTLSTIFLWIVVLVWCGYVLCMGVLIFKSDQGTVGQARGPFDTGTSTGSILSDYFLPVFCGAFLIALPLLVLFFVSLSYQQLILVVCLLVITALNALPSISKIPAFTIPGLGRFPGFSNAEKYFTKEYEDSLNSTVATTVPTALIQQPTGPFPNPANIQMAQQGPWVYPTQPIPPPFAAGGPPPPPPNMATGFSIQPTPQQFNFTSSIDPAAVALNRRQLMGSRVKMV